MVIGRLSVRSVAMNNAGTKPHAGDGIPWSSTELLAQIIECGMLLVLEHSISEHSISE